MLKNMKLAPRMILIGGLLIIIPLLIVSTIAASKAGSGLKAAANEQLATRSKGIAKLVNSVLIEQKRFIKQIAMMPEVVQVAESVKSKGIKSSSAELKKLNEYFYEMTKTKELGDNIQGISLIDLDGTVVASDQVNSLGISTAERSYFRNAKYGKTNIGEVAMNKILNKPFVSFAAPVLSRQGDVIGVVMYLYNIHFLSNMITDETIGETGYAYIIDQNGYFIAHFDQSNILKVNAAKTKGMEAFSHKMIDGKAGVDAYEYDGIPKTAGYAPVQVTGWSVGMTLPDDEYMAPVSQLQIYMLIVGFIAVVIALIAFFVFAMSLANSLKKGVSFARQIAEGNLGATIDLDQKDEIGILATALKNMATELRLAISDIGSVMTSVKEGDLSKHVTANLAGDLVQLKESINDSITMLNHTMVQVVSSSEQVKAGSTELASSAQSLASGATEQAASLEETSSSMSEVGSRAKTNNENANQAVQLSGQTLEIVDRSNSQMKEMLASMDKINGSSTDISKIIKVIDEIAFQTNLLALNAAVEAARAGKYGKGFAVVAEEVRNLAARSAEAARNTTELIENSIKEVESGVDNAGKTAEILNEINSSITKVSDLVGEISASSQEQSVSITEINEALTQVNTVVQQNSSISEESAAASEELSGQAMQLQELMNRFSLIHEETFQKIAPVKPEVLAQPETQENPPEPARMITLDDDNFGKY